jgi:hypothetical protein
MILFARLAITVWLFVLITKLHLENGFAVSESRTETVAEPRIETVSEPARRTSSLQAQEQREPLAQRTCPQKSAQFFPRAGLGAALSSLFSSSSDFRGGEYMHVI